MNAELLELAVTAATQAADLVRARASAGVQVAATKSSDVDVVTQADRDSETLIRSIILEARPRDSFLGEEGNDQTGDSDVRWIVDPIDGTVNFLYGLPDFAISIAAERAGVLVAGVVLNAATGAAYVAVRAVDGTLTGDVLQIGGPAAVDALTPLARLGVRAPVPLSQQLLITGFGYDPLMREAQAQALVRLLPRVRDIRRHGSAALELCRVACGQADAYAEVGVNLWDYAAGVLVAEAAGARWQVLPGLAGRDLVVCAPVATFDEVVRAVLEAGFGDPKVGPEFGE
jgi:myo-inositol-1(or 4)-monophosphatase